ncbi:MAG: hypothetical protein U1E17_16495 [Geminicoccaceae bacterium]
MSSTNATLGASMAQGRLGLSLGPRDAGTLLGLAAIATVFALLSPSFLDYGQPAQHPAATRSMPAWRSA